VWLSVRSEVQIVCIIMVQLMPLPSQNPVVSCLVQIRTGFTVPVPAYAGCPGKEDAGRVQWYRVGRRRNTATRRPAGGRAGDDRASDSWTSRLTGRPAACSATTIYDQSTGEATTAQSRASRPCTATSETLPPPPGDIVYTR